MSQSVHVHAFRDLLDGGGVVDDPEQIATYTTDQRQLFTGATLAVLKPATTKQVADIVRIKDGILVEHWDVIQDEVTREQSKSGLPMFGDAFPK